MTALPMSCSSAARRAVFGARAELVGHHRGELRALDRVARARSGRSWCGSCSRPSSLTQLRIERRARSASNTACSPSLDDVRLELGLRLVVGLLDPRRMDAAVLEQLLERHARDLAADAVEAPTARPRAGVSSMMKSTPVRFSSARMLRPSRPMMRPFMSSLGSCTTRHRRLGGVAGRRAAACTPTRMLRTRRSASRLVSSSTWRSDPRRVVARLRPRPPSAAPAWPARRSAPATRSSSRRCSRLRGARVARELARSRRRVASRRSRSAARARRGRPRAVERALERSRALAPRARTSVGLAACARRGSVAAGADCAAACGVRARTASAAATRPTARTSRRDDDLPWRIPSSRPGGVPPGPFAMSMRGRARGALRRKRLGDRVPTGASRRNRQRSVDGRLLGARRWSRGRGRFGCCGFRDPSAALRRARSLRGS